MAYSKVKVTQFSKDFNWGVTISAYQNEGKWNTYGKGKSIWDTFTNKPNFKNGNGNVATNFYHHYKEDIKRVKELNLDSFRFSISWSRIFPEGTGKINQKGVDFYHKVIDSCIELNIQPWVTLYHWDLPQALEDKGGWTNREVLNWFENYVDFCTKEYGDKVKNWIVLNEPMSFVGLGYFMNMHAPGKRGIKNFLSAAHHTTLCQALGGRIIRKNVKDAFIGTTFSCSYVKPVNRLVKNKKAAERIDTLLNRFFIEPALGLGYPIDTIPGLKQIEKYYKPDDEEMMKFDFDFIGIQYYFKIVAKFSLLPPILFATEIPATKRNVKTNNMGMEIYPKGLLKMLEKFNAYTDIKNIYITESGVCFDDVLENGKVKDKKRIDYFKKTFFYTLKALEKNIKVKGYFIWTLVDNFEWAEGTKPRFGLYYTDFITQKRIIKKSGLWIQKFLSKKQHQS
ncbi:GH1 family beta-glucosidase [Wenyingzhuangia sp. chi5]|uniref:Beta-glucosidase n=1 Tax=Wenyingzhuangia gilva TaxID=3057677 RepID=A0ABT8VRL3_9FLAO|nr:GH1 family beta-glucosidase [Wenyingzhuangia sp. chi5]MDO3694602.1 GH1 family beta-glucosidase [Wenyingzhuangia sp. chi5]